MHLILGGRAFLRKNLARSLLAQSDALRIFKRAGPDFGSFPEHRDIEGFFVTPRPHAELRIRPIRPVRHLALVGNFGGVLPNSGKRGNVDRQR